MKRRIAVALIALLSFALVSTALARILPDADPSEHEPDAFTDELATFERMGDGIVLTLAACEEEPHCITAVSEHELGRLIEQLDARIALLEEHEAGNGIDPAYLELLGDYRRLRDRYADFLGEYEQVAAVIDRDALEGEWVDLLDFGVDEGPQVPAPNDSITLDRFVDANMPMPLD